MVPSPHKKRKRVVPMILVLDFMSAIRFVSDVPSTHTHKKLWSNSQFCREKYVLFFGHYKVQPP